MLCLYQLRKRTATELRIDRMVPNGLARRDDLNSDTRFRNVSDIIYELYT